MNSVLNLSVITGKPTDIFSFANTCTVSGHNYSPPLENSIDYMYFHVCKKKHSASPGQHIFMFLVSFER